MKTYQLMSQDFISVEAETPVSDIIHLLGEYRVNGVPVVDREGRLVGLVSQRDLFAHLDDTRLEFDEAFAGLHAADVMARQVLCVGEGDDVSEVAWLVARYGVDTLPVLRDGRLVGVVSRVDLIRLYALAG